MYCIDGRYKNIIIENFSNYNGQSCNDGSDCYSNFCANNICYNGSTCNGFGCPNESNCSTKEVTFDASGNLTSAYNDIRICIKSKKGENGPKYRDRTNAGRVLAPTTPPAPTTLAIINTDTTDTGATNTDATDTGATDTGAIDTTDETDITAEASATTVAASATTVAASTTTQAASTTTQVASTTTQAASTTTTQAASTTTQAAAVATTINTTEGEFEQDIQTDDDEEYNLKIDIENIDDENVDDENIDDENVDDEENNNNFMTPRFKRMLIISGSFAGFIILILIIILIIIFARG